MVTEHINDEYSILITGKPRSGNARSKRARGRLKRYKNRIGKIATGIFPNPLGDEIEVIIYHFHEGKVIDMDNLAKPILDGLTSVAYTDDEQVGDLNLKRISLKQPRKIENVTSSLIPQALAGKKECVVVIVRPIT